MRFHLSSSVDSAILSESEGIQASADSQKTTKIRNEVPLVHDKELTSIRDQLINRVLDPDFCWSSTV